MCIRSYIHIRVQNLNNFIQLLYLSICIVLLDIINCNVIGMRKVSIYKSHFYNLMSHRESTSRYNSALYCLKRLRASNHYFNNNCCTHKRLRSCLRQSRCSLYGGNLICTFVGQNKTLKARCVHSKNVYALFVL